jgi:3-oxoacyl-[acyl-carrier protein] reductase
VETKALRAGVSDSDVLKAELEKIPLHRFARSEEIAEAISFLASPMSSYINGIGLPVDG